MNVYEIVTNKIIEKIKQGAIPWHKPWNTYPAVSWLTQKPYRGINALLLDPGEYATFKQVLAAGGRVKKEECKNFSIVVFWKWVEKETGDIDPDTGEEKISKFPLLRYYRVYEINSQCEGLESKRKDVIEYHHDPIEEAEKLVEGYVDSPRIKFAPGQAFYRPSEDLVSVPEMKDYKKPEEYYSTLLHELVHSTGHRKRLCRKGIIEPSFFGSHEYSKEELVAEIGAAMLCSLAGIENATIDNSVAYLQGWLKVLKEDSKMIVFAASQAQKAVDYITGQNCKEEEYLE